MHVMYGAFNKLCYTKLELFYLEGMATPQCIIANFKHFNRQNIRT